MSPNPSNMPGFWTILPFPPYPQPLLVRNECFCVEGRASQSNIKLYVNLLWSFMLSHGEHATYEGCSHVPYTTKPSPNPYSSIFTLFPRRRLPRAEEGHAEELLLSFIDKSPFSPDFLPLCPFCGGEIWGSLPFTLKEKFKACFSM